VTKTDTLELINAFYDSLDKLKLSSVHGLLIHDANDILVKGSEFLIDALKKLKAQNKVKKIGISVYEPKDLVLICSRLEPDIVQLPINVLDQRFIKDKSLNFLKKKGIEIHARSIFLQGLLLYKNLEFPVFFKKWDKILERWKISCHKQGFSFIEAIMSFASSIKEVDCFILGFENITQFSECVNFLKKKNRIKFNAQGLECNDINLINPINWKI
jgi:aryl-alcohol dehydrogenase-like predicted oxidoreductase